MYVERANKHTNNVLSASGEQSGISALKHYEENSTQSA